MKDYGVPELVGRKSWLASGRWQVRLNGKYRYASHVVWEYFNGPIPAGFVVHHRNGDAADDRPENLFCLAWGAHNRQHHLGCKRSTESRAKMMGNKNALGNRGFLGRKRTAETRAKFMGNANALGFKHTAETRRRMSAAQRNRWRAKHLATTDAA